MIASCQWFPACSGCDDIGSSDDAQRDSHLRRLANFLEQAKVSYPKIGYHRPSPWGARNRLDFILKDGHLGLYSIDREEVIDLPDCAQLHPTLQQWLEEFRANLPPVRLGSLRLRVSPDGRRGMWLDFANLDIKNLFDSRIWLESWPPEVIIEMGQKRKSVEITADGPRFRDPVFYPWFTTKWRDQNVPLYGVVGGFSQPSFQANEWITTWFRDRVLEINPTQIVEFGSGNGNLSFPALSGNAQLTACENDLLSLKGFQKTLDHFTNDIANADLKSRVILKSGDFQKSAGLSLLEANLLIANPPRSGLKAFLDPLPDAKQLDSILYMSCHAESFAIDAQRIYGAGFKLKELTLLDQFPQTKHIEVLSRWDR